MTMLALLVLALTLVDGGISKLPGAPGARVLPRVVILGGSGRIGTAVAAQLLA